MSLFSTRDPAQRRLLLLTAILFVSYLCVGIALPIVALHVTRRLGLANVGAGLAVGIAFLATVATRGHAGTLADRRGTKVAVTRGLSFYVADLRDPRRGPLLLGLGESLVAVGVISWGIALVGSARSGQVLARVGAALYAVAPQAGAQRPSFRHVLGSLWRHGAVVCLQGIGFAAIGAFLTGLGCSMIFPAMGRDVVRVVAPSLRGTALGAFAAFQDVAYGLAGPLAGWLADRAGVDSVFLAGAVAAVLGIAIALGLRRAAAVTAPA